MYKRQIKESVESFNRVFGRINNIEVVTKHWSTDSYPQSGDKPQELLNKQLVRDCDAAVALFWTRFGTPTDKYASGTEEEIEEMLSAGKQVFMYFLDVPVNPSQVDMEQYKKIIDFREKYKDKGIYAIIKDKMCIRDRSMTTLVEVEKLLKFATKAEKQIDAFDSDIFENFIEEIIVFSQEEIGFKMKCGRCV